MALSKEVAEYYKLVCDLGQKGNVKEGDHRLSMEIININNSYETASFNVNKACQYLNNSTSDIIKGRTCSSTISIGKESVPLIVSAKTMADSFFSTDIEGCGINIEEQLQNSLSKVEDNFHHLEDFRKQTSKSIRNLEYLIKHVIRQYPQEKNLSTVSEISSFLDKDFVASSPINFH